MNWLRVEVIEVREGAAYEGVLYDQDIVVRTGAGAVLSLFDMSPMIAQGVRPGECLEVVVSVSAPGSVRRGGSAELSEPDVRLERSGWDGFRDDLLRRPLCVLSTPDGDLVISPSELPPGLAVGERLAWDDARLDLLAWRRESAGGRNG